MKHIVKITLVILSLICIVGGTIWLTSEENFGIFKQPKNKADALKILGLQEDATDKDIKTAYRKLSLKYHPDKNPGILDEDDDGKLDLNDFKYLHNAYEILIKLKETGGIFNSFDDLYLYFVSLQNKIWKENFPIEELTKMEKTIDEEYKNFIPLINTFSINDLTEINNQYRFSKRLITSKKSDIMSEYMEKIRNNLNQFSIEDLNQVEKEFKEIYDKNKPYTDTIAETYLTIRQLIGQGRILKRVKENERLREEKNKEEEKEREEMRRTDRIRMNQNWENTINEIRMKGEQEMKREEMKREEMRKEEEMRREEMRRNEEMRRQEMRKEQQEMRRNEEMRREEIRRNEDEEMRRNEEKEKRNKKEEQEKRKIFDEIMKYFKRMIDKILNEKLSNEELNKIEKEVDIFYTKNIPILDEYDDYNLKNIVEDRYENIKDTINNKINIKDNNNNNIKDKKHKELMREMNELKLNESKKNKNTIMYIGIGSVIIIALYFLLKKRK